MKHGRWLRVSVALFLALSLSMSGMGMTTVDSQESIEATDTSTQNFFSPLGNGSSTDPFTPSDDYATVIKPAIEGAQDGDKFYFTGGVFEFVGDAIQVPSGARITLTGSENSDSPTVLKSSVGERHFGCAMSGPSAGCFIEVTNIQFIADGTGGGIDDRTANPDSHLQFSSCTFTGLTGEDGATRGGAVVTDGTATFDGCAFTECSVGGEFGEEAGGAVWAETVNMTKCLVTGNRAPGRGGAVYSTNLTLTDCEFRYNRGTTFGGAVFTEYGTIADSIFEGNETDTPEERGFAVGGAVNAVERLVVNNSTFISNKSKNGGGALNAFELELRASVFRENTTYETGGAVCAEEATISDTSFIDNTAGEGGGFWGKDVDMTACEIMDNQGGTGGGIRLWGIGKITNCTISGNTADWWGGGVTTGEPNSPCELTLVNCAVENNSSLNDAGGGIFLNDGASLEMIGGVIKGNHSGDVGGGGIWGNEDTKIQLREVAVSNNSTTGSGGGMSSDFITLQACTISNNTSQDGAGGVEAFELSLTNTTIAQNSGATTGGIDTRTAVLRSSTISGNRATTTSGAGGVHVTGNIDMRGTIVAGNYNSAGQSEINDYNGDGSLSDTFGSSNIVGIPSAGLSSLLDTTLDNGRAVGRLADNGGATQTILINSSGPAFKVVNVSASGNWLPETDQRGISRRQGEYADVGAVELEGRSVPVTPVAPPSAPSATSDMDSAPLIGISILALLVLLASFALKRNRDPHRAL